jgi:predicted ATP-grasp superfamily ATP-dependent carboligase
VSTLCESTSVDPEALEYGTRLLSHLGWHGVAMVEFKRDDRDGALRLMEINARFWGSLQLAIDAGVDFPGILVDIAMGQEPPALPAYRLGARSRWLLGDLDVALLVLLRGRKKLNLPASFPPRLRFLREVLHVSGPEERWEVYDRDDPRPWWLELRHWLFRGRFF